ncbi:MAG: filamentous hemagglutinin N-terminal domain-containing protein [Heteroscytonema crispum UTEX LB 1556]
MSFCYLTTNSTIQAQESPIVPDNTLPNNSIVTPQDNVDVITGGTVKASNLFHSFGKFKIEEGRKADFVSPRENIDNILVRVTGGSRSEILGTLATSGLSNPNLFLINPNGIVFGANARLQVGGSFVATTANAIAFGNQGFFNASIPNNPELLTVNPSAFLFNQISTPITKQSGTILQVPNGKSLLLAGGNINLNGGGLQARGGRIELAAVAGMGILGLNYDSNQLSLNIPDSVRRGDISLTNTTLSAGGGSIAIASENLGLQRSILDAEIIPGSTQGGDIILDAKQKMTIANSRIINNVGFSTVGNTGNINLKAGSLSLNNSILNSSTFGRGNTAGIFLQGKDSVDIANSSILSNVGDVAAIGNTGGVNIKAGSFTLNNGSTLRADTFGKGETAGVFVQADGFVDIADSVISTQAGNTAIGNGSNINIQAGTVSLTYDSVLNTSTYTERRAGNVIIHAKNNVAVDNSRISSDTFDVGNGGIIDVKARELSLTNGGVLLSTTTGRGTAGNIQINAADIAISGVDAEEGFSSGLITASEEEGSGQGGDISVTTNRLRVSNGAVLNARTRSASNGGNITVNTETLDLTSGGQLLTSAFKRGNAGNITVNATDSVSISGSDATFAERLAKFGARIVDNDGANSGLFARVRSEEAANAGKIEVNARSIRLSDRAIISTATTLGEGGDITLNARDILLRNHSSITATAGTAQAGGNGGNINIDSDLLAAANNSDITANAFAGKGGNIRINTQGIFLSPDSDITASSELGVNGVVEITRPDIDPTSGLINLPDAPPVDTKVAQGCQPGGNQQQSEFIITGRGGLPASPKDILSNDDVIAKWVTVEPEGQKPFHASVRSKPATPKPIVEATGWVVNALGEVILIAAYAESCNI